MHKEIDTRDLELKGSAKFLSNLLHIIMYPLLKPVKFCIIVVFVCFIYYFPVLTHKVEYKDIGNWYGKNISSLTDTFFPNFKSHFSFTKSEQKLTLKEQRELLKNKAKRKQLEKKSHPAAVNYSKKYEKHNKKE